MKIKGQVSDREWDSFSAIMCAETEDGSPQEVLEAWAFIGQNGLHRHLQGFFGRGLENMINMELLDENFIPQWDEFDSYMDYHL